MKVLMDGRSLLRPWMGGVPRLASQLVPTIEAALKPDELITVVTGLGTARPLPNKLVAFLTWSGLSSFDRLFHDQHADVLFLPNIEFVGRPALPYALLVHDLSFLIEPRWFNWKMRIWHKVVKPKMLIKNASALFTVSETSKHDLMRLLDIPEERITVIPMGLDKTEPTGEAQFVVGAQRAAPLQQIAPQRFILCLGANNHRKNTECVIAAHEELIKQEKYKDVKLVITGATAHDRGLPPAARGLPPAARGLPPAARVPPPSCFLPPQDEEGVGSPARIGSEPPPHPEEGAGGGGGPGVEERAARVRGAGVIEIGRPSYADLFALMRDASVFCYPSWYEGFGMPLHEAARFGTPCIASTASSLPEIAPQGTRFASPAKPQHWLEAISQTLDHPENHRTQTILGDWKPAGVLIAEKLKGMVQQGRIG